MSEEQQLHILAIGDSLTDGCYNDGQSHHPYSTLLTTLLTIGNIPAIIDQRGVSGERVVPTMVNRLQHLLAKDASYDWIII